MTIPFIAEKAIDAVSASLNETGSDKYDQAIADMQAKQPILFSYLISESFKLLTDEESKYLIYLALVIWKSVDSTTPALELLMSENIEEVEDALVDDEDSFVTKEGKELLFIGLKTTIDTLCQIAV